MNNSIETWRVVAFTQSVYQLSQQMDSRLAPTVRKEVFKGKAEFFDRLELATAQFRTSRNADTPNLNITNSRRMVTTQLCEWATLVDRKDKLQNIHDPENEYAKSARYAIARQLDITLINAALGTAYSGETGTTSNSLGTAQKCVPISGGAQSKMNVSALLQAKALLDAAEVPEEKRYFVHDASALQNMLGQTQVTSADYNTVKALVNGEMDTFLGFKCIRTQLIVPSSTYSSAFTYDPVTGLYSTANTALTISSSSNSNFVYQGDGLILGMNEGAVGRIDERPDKGYNMQVYASMDFGGVRMEEARVVEIPCLP